MYSGVTQPGLQLSSRAVHSLPESLRPGTSTLNGPIVTARSANQHTKCDRFLDTGSVQALHELVDTNLALDTKLISMHKPHAVTVYTVSQPESTSALYAALLRHQQHKLH